MVTTRETIIYLP